MDQSFNVKKQLLETNININLRLLNECKVAVLYNIGKELYLYADIGIFVKAEISDAKLMVHVENNSQDYTYVSIKDIYRLIEHGKKINIKNLNNLHKEK